MSDNNLNSADPTRDIYDVTRLNREVRTILEGSFPLIWVQAEISNLVRPASGHMYFSLKDKQSQVRCAMFRHRNRSLKFEPENGASVLVRANVSLYEDRGEYQLIIEHMEPAGDGLLQIAFEELKQRLFSEGLFDEIHKKIIPHMPMTIGVITSPTGAALRDILSIMQRRFPAATIIVYPTAVQGEEAADQIIKMLKVATQRNECDVLILARGGGSLEDLWVFNNEKVARALFHCLIPVVTGIGHEIDFTIADFVADQRAATPSAAAELVSPDQIQIKESLLEKSRKLLQIISDKIDTHKLNIAQLNRQLSNPARDIQTFNQRLDVLNMRMMHLVQSSIDFHKNKLSEIKLKLTLNNPAQSVQFYYEKCTQIKQQLQHCIKYNLRQFNSRLDNLSKTLDAISPLASLNRGYAIVNKIENDEIVRSVDQLREGDAVLTRFSNGHTHSIINKINKNE